MKYEVGGTLTVPYLKNPATGTIVAVLDKRCDVRWDRNNRGGMYSFELVDFFVQEQGYIYTPPSKAPVITAIAHTCTCDMRDLMMRGCKCGYLAIGRAV
jgi:hypothetical protein